MAVRVIFAIAMIGFTLVSESLRPQRISVGEVVGVFEALLLVIYLSSPRLKKKMGNAYLPLAFVIATLGPIFENYLYWDLLNKADVQRVWIPPESSDIPAQMLPPVVLIGPNRLAEFYRMRTVTGSWQLMLMLMVPLILISWKYSFSVVVGYCAFLGLLDFLPNVIAWVHTGINMAPALGVTFIRLLLLLMVAYVVEKMADGLRKQNRQLEQANQTLATYNQTLEQLATSRERNRLARELHDTVAHTLSAVAVQLEAVSALWKADPEKAQELLAQSQTTTREGLQETRRAIQAMRSTSLEEMGLALSLKSLALSLADRNGLELHLDITDSLPILKPEMEHSIYRIAEEALRNAVRHAAARLLTVTLKHESPMIYLTITDDGQGFNVNQSPGEECFGLQGMREHAEMIGANLTIQSDLGKGTRIFLSVEG